MPGAGAALRWKVLATGSTVLAAFAARKVITTAWKATTGHEPPANPESRETTWGEALAWAMASGAVVGVARMLAARKAADYWERATGELPPGLEEGV
ncbi:MAG: DUF4235 domain-containing protein [Carbonactinosporaceae bacterium]